MASSLARNPLVLSLSLLLLLPSFLLGSSAAALSYHRGPILTGNVNLTILWYGQVGRVHKNAIRTFIKSLNYNGNVNFEPRVSNWWHLVESYQSAARRNMRSSPRIRVQVVRQVTDATFSAGKIITQDFLPGLIQKATGGNRETVAVIFSAKDVTVQGQCEGKCAQHGVIGRQVYITVGNPESACPEACAWPFHKAKRGPQGVTLQPPSGNVGADAMVINFASALVSTVTNPYNTGFYEEPRTNPIEAGTACPGQFGSGAFPGYTGKVRVDPASGGGFNAHGVRGKKFLLPAIWNPKTSSCWTIM
ncbi:hypothetical protein L1049_002105 [Liquidambar formosana]|uniref:Protein EXORDIUM-like 2 n=1 Tax=Liquidambar formosana TaxID=63359 RepID=A0AAP0NEA5_LIQFO